METVQTVAPPTPTASSHRPDAPSRSRSTLLTGLALVAILLLAAALRLWQLPSLPPGLNHDEGVNALDVEQIIAGWRPVFLPANNGREALFMYSQAVVGGRLGVTPASLRLTAALWGVLTVALTFALARRWYGDRTGLLAAGLLAVAFWHVVLSRVGLRAISAPAMYVAVLWLLTEALQRRRLALFVVAGALLGLSEYTYLSARLLPFILIVICLGVLAQHRRRRLPLGSLVFHLAFTAVVAGVTVLPEAIYFFRHPELLIGRTDQVLVFSSSPAIIGTPITFQQSLERTFGMFWVAGDANWLHNIAGLPVLDPPLTIAFLAGIAALLVELWRGHREGAPALTVLDGTPASTGRRHIVDVTPAFWLFVWSGALLTGSSVTQESPNYLRLTALMPAVAIVCAVGASTLLDLLRRFLAGRRLSFPAVAIVSLSTALVVGEGVRTANLYFNVWAKQGGVYTAFDTDIRDAAAASLRQTAIPIADTFIQLDASAPFLYFRPETADARWLREYSTVVALPPPGQPALWIYAHFQETPPLSAYLPNSTLVAHGDAHPGHPGYFLYRSSVESLAAFLRGFAAPDQPERFGDFLQLAGTKILTPATARPGDSISVLLLWRVMQDATDNFGVSVHLTDAHSVTWAQSDRQGMMRNGWHSGDLFVSRHAITLPADLPPVPLRVDVSASVLDSLHQPAAVLQTLGAPVSLTTIAVAPGAPGNAAPPSDAVAVVPGLAVDASPITSASVGPGDTLSVTLHWWRTMPIPPLDVAVALINAGGTTIATAEGNPAYGALPVAQLPTGRPVADVRMLRLPAVLPSGPLQVVLIATTSNGRPAVQVRLGQIQAQDRQHNFTLPVSQHPLSGIFGGQIALEGYDLPGTIVSPGGSLPITFNWQAVQTPNHDYTVFVHLLNALGQIVAQNDSQPAHGSLPTRGWLTREVVTDPHVIPVPPSLAPGNYRLELGWYDAATNERLSLASPPGADHVVLSQAIAVR